MYFAYDLHITTREPEGTSCQLHPVLARRLITGEVDSPSHSDRQTPSDTTSVLLPFLSGEFAIPSDTPFVLLLSLSGEFAIPSDTPSVLLLSLSGEFAIPSDTPSVLLSLSGEFVISSDIPSVSLPF